MNTQIFPYANIVTGILVLLVGFIFHLLNITFYILSFFNLTVYILIFV